MVAPATWTGFYVGVNAGYGWSNDNSVNIVGTPAGGIGPVEFQNALAQSANASLPFGNNNGFIGGGQIGYNYQFLNGYVVGIEAELARRAQRRY